MAMKARKIKVIDYYFSVMSDWAYLGGQRLEQMARRYGATVNHMPIKLYDVYAGTGGIMLQNRSKQRQDYRIVELRRWRDYLGMPLNISPRYFPIDDEPASLVVIAAKRLRLDVGALANSILAALWTEERNIAEPNTLRQIADGHGMDGAKLLKLARTDVIRKEFTRYTVEAQQRGVFGSPFYLYKGDIFWGQDRLEFLERALASSR